MSDDADAEIHRRLAADSWPAPEGLADAVAARLLAEAPRPKSAKRRRVMKRVIHGLATAGVAAVVLGTLLTVLDRPPSSAFAAELATVAERTAEAKTIVWDRTVYSATVDGKPGAIGDGRITTTTFYEAPDHFREEERYDGKLTGVTVTDTTSGRQLKLNVQKKTAKFAPPETIQFRTGHVLYGAAGKLAKATGLQPLNADQLGVPGEEAAGLVGFRQKSYQVPNRRMWGNDYWVDKKTKRIAAFRGPSLDLLDPTKDYERGPEVRVGFVLHNVRYDEPLNGELFSLEVPDGYTLVEPQPLPRVTEKDIVEYVAAYAAASGGQYVTVGPDSPQHSQAERLETLNKALRRRADKGLDALTEEQRRLLAVDEKYRAVAHLGYAPFFLFFGDDSAAGDSVDDGKTGVHDSWRFIGEGVELGDGSKMVAVYRLKNGDWRAIYGDKRVEDVEPEDIPVPVR